MSPKKRKQIMDELILIQNNKNGVQKNEINLKENVTKQAPKYRTKTLVEINDNIKPGDYAASDQTIYQTTMLKSSL